MRIHVVDHPLVSHKLTNLRDETTDSPTFRRLVDQLVTLLAYEATRDVRVDMKTRTLESGGPVEGRMTLGTFSAGRLRADLDERHVVLDGGASLKIRQGALN